MRYSFIILSIIALLVIPGIKAHSQPIIEFDMRTYDFGTTYPHNSLSHDFILTNKGNEILNIASITKSCGCTGAIVSATAVLPAATSVVSVTLTTSYPGKKQEAVEVHCNDPESPIVRLEVATTVKNLWSFSPQSTFFFSAVPINSERSMQLLMKNIEGDLFKVLATQVKDPELSVQVGKPNEEGVPIILTVKAGSKKQMITDVLEIRTDHPKQPIARISVAAKIVGYIQFSHNRIFFGRIDRGQLQTLEITATLPENSSEELTITDIKSDKGQVTGKVLEKRPDGAIRILLTFTPPDKAGYHSGLITFKTNIKNEPETTLPYSALVKGS